MTDEELDALYGELCRSLTRAGESRAPLVLARFALLAIGAIDDPVRIRSLLAAAGDLAAPGLPNTQLTTSEPARENI
jgi:hypothetical protein